MAALHGAGEEPQAGCQKPWATVVLLAHCVTLVKTQHYAFHVGLGLFQQSPLLTFKTR